jgi:hypothetical protein
MICEEVLRIASRRLLQLKNSTLDFISIKPSADVAYVKHLARTISKLSPSIGNMLEFEMVSYLNGLDCWRGFGRWRRQDPGFPDAVFMGRTSPRPGIEIKTWFPLATEITARFRETVTHFRENQTNVAVVAWLPDHVFYGKPYIIDVWVDSARGLAQVRDLHYHNPPDYLVLEPEDTSRRTVNLQQTNTNGFKFQGNQEQLRRARAIVASWGPRGKLHKTSPAYQRKLRSLYGQFRYRGDTNFAKMDRIQHEGLEAFKARVLKTKIQGRHVIEWAGLLQRYEQAIGKVEALELKRGMDGVPKTIKDGLAECIREFEATLSELV